MLGERWWGKRGGLFVYLFGLFWVCFISKYPTWLEAVLCIMNSPQSGINRVDIENMHYPDNRKTLNLVYLQRFLAEKGIHEF